MRAVATWAMRLVLTAAAVCGAATLTCTVFHRADAANHIAGDDVDPLAVSPRKPPLDAGHDGADPLPPLPDARVPLTDAAVTPLTAM